MLILWGIGSAHAAALCDSNEACLRLIETSQRSTRVMVTQFVQTKHLSLLSEPLITRGRFAFQQPDQVFWIVDDPPLTVHIDRQGVHFPQDRKAKEAQAEIAPFGRMLRELSGLFTGKLDALSATFTVSASSDASTIALHLVPKSPDWQRMFRAIDVVFAQPELTIRSLHLDEALGDRLEISFSQVHRNDTFADQTLAALIKTATPTDD